MKKKLTLIITLAQAKKILQSIPIGKSITILPLDLNKILDTKTWVLENPEG